jgi:hypothetical protein
MANQLVDIYLADLALWNGLGPGGAPGQAVTPPIPERRSGVDLVVPTIGVGYAWSQTISLILSDLDKGQQIDKFFMAGHGSAGAVTIGRTLTWRDDSTIAEFQRLRPFAPVWRTNVYIIGCEVAADGPCQPMPVNFGGKVEQACVGLFSGHTEKPGYQLLRKLADAINAPVHGTTWKLPLDARWPDQLRHAPRLTVGPGGGWVYRGGFVGEVTRFGSP